MSRVQHLLALAVSVELQGATDAVAADRRLDALYRQALSSATRSYCRLI